jgi:hypothetical protein
MRASWRLVHTKLLPPFPAASADFSPAYSKAFFPACGPAKDAGLIAPWLRDGGGRAEPEPELPAPEGTLAPSPAYRALFPG